jgi:FkbM family methyltransferase
MQLKNAALAPIRSVLSTWYRDGEVYTIPFGVNRGMKMRYFGELQYHMILGLHEQDVVDAIGKALVACGKTSGPRVYFDLGANVGSYALWFSRLLPQGKVFSFEPVPDTYWSLRDNLALNEVTNVQAFQMACTDRAGKTTLYLGETSHEQASLYADVACKFSSPRSITVEATSIDEFLLARPEVKQVDFIRMDIEGGGVVALPGAYDSICEYRPLLCVESHMAEEDRAIGELLVECRYEAYKIAQKCWVEDPTKTFPDKTGVSGTVICIPRELMPRASNVLR